MKLRPGPCGILPCLLALSLAPLPAQVLTPAKPVPAKLVQLRTLYTNALARLMDPAKPQREAYLDTLAKLAAKVQAAGDLDRLLKINAERKSVAETGAVTEAQDPELDAPRKSYLEAKAATGSETAAKIIELDNAYQGRLKILEVELTKAVQLDDALEVRHERERIQTEVASLAPAPALVPTTPPPPAITNVPAKKDAGDDPPLAIGHPFNQTLWNQPMTLPSGRHRVVKKIVVDIPKERRGGAAEIVFTKGSTVSSSTDGTLMFGRSHVEARETEFVDLRLRGDLSSRIVFEGCTLKNSTVGKGGAWYGGDYASKWSFDNCTIERSFIEVFKVWDVGLHLTDSTVQNVTLPTVQWNDRENDSSILSEWLQVRRTRFTHCKIPLSFLMITDACSFVDCTYLQDAPNVILTKPLTVHLYQDHSSTDRLKQLPPNLILKEHSLAELPKA